MAELPAHVRELFWEGLAEEPDPERHADYIAISTGLSSRRRRWRASRSTGRASIAASHWSVEEAVEFFGREAERLLAP